MPSNELSTPVEPGRMPLEGITVIGEAIRRAAPESAEFVIEIATSAPSAAQALRDQQAKTVQLAHALAGLGVQQGDLETLSMNVFNSYAPAVAGYGGFPQLPRIDHGAFPGFGAASLPTAPLTGPLSGELQFGSYQARSVLRVNMREPGRVGEAVDVATRAGAILVGGFSFKVADEGQARRAVLEAAGRDARAKAETLAAATGKQLGDPVAIAEDLMVSNGTYAALRTAFPFAFGIGTPRPAGELEYYARVSANFRLQ